MSPAPHAFWRLDETSGARADDAAGGHDGDYRGGVRLGVPGIASGSSKAAGFDGVNDCVAVTFDGAPLGKQSLMILGDSFTVPGRNFPNALETRLEGKGYDLDVIAYSKSGDDTGEALARLKAYFNDPHNVRPDAALVALGTNDALDGMATAKTEANLRQICDLFQSKGVDVLLCGTDPYYPTAKGAKGFADAGTQHAFEAVFPRVAKAEGVLLEPNLIEGLYNDPIRVQSDGLHPSWKGTAYMAGRALPEAMDLLDHAGGGGGGAFNFAEGTVSLSFKADDTGGRQALFSKDAAGYGNGGGTSLWLEGDQLRLRFEGETSVIALKSADGAIKPGEVHHAAFTFDRDTGTHLYLDGQQVGGRSFLDDWQGNDEAILIGARNPNGASGAVTNVKDFFHGTIDDVAVFDTALSGNEVRALAADGMWV